MRKGVIMKNKKLVKIVSTAMLSAVSFVLFLFEFPVIPGAEHLKLDFSDIPALVAGLTFGAPWAVSVELVKNLVELLVKGMGTQMGFGNVMNFLVGCAFTVPFCLVWKKLGENMSGVRRVLASGAAATVSILVIGFFGNLLIDPPYFKYFLGIELTKQQLMPAVWSATAINAVKGVMLCVAALPIATALLKRIQKTVRV